MSIINQKDYLKKYLKIGKKPGEKKKKIRTKKPSGKGLKIIDDDVYTNLSQEIQVDIDAANEDAPQIVSVIDDRPPSMRIDEKTKSNLWQPIGSSNVTSSDVKSFEMGSIRLHKNEEPTILSSKNKLKNLQSLMNVSKNVDDSSIRYDFPIKKNKSENLSPLRIRNETSPASSNDFSSPRKKDEDYSPHRAKDKDYSPPRKKNKDISPPSRNDKDISPPRRNNKDFSPPRRNNKDFSPPRRNDRDFSPPRRIDKGSFPPRRNDKDYSPPRRKNKTDFKPRREEKDYSPLRKKVKDSPTNEDYSPPRKTSLSEIEDSEVKRKHSSLPLKRKSSRWEKDDSVSKPEATLSGKKSGLQNAQNLIEDLARLQKQEEEIFKTMSADISGVNAATVIRRKKQEKLIDPEKEARDTELKEKYSVWGKGLKQVQDETTKYEDQLKEMNKPMARYADDEDLEKYLKEQERDGDPMLAYIRKKRKKVAVEQGVSEKPMYMGDFMPNRYGIRPGYRWDGVDRSNGYETKWFQTQNSKKAMQDEALMWSTEDM